MRSPRSARDRPTRSGRPVGGGGHRGRTRATGADARDDSQREPRERGACSKRREAWGIVLNKNTVPGETRSPFVTSGIRTGTACVTTRGFAEEEVERVADVVVDVFDAPDDGTVRSRASDTVGRLCEAYPVYK